MARAWMLAVAWLLAGAVVASEEHCARARSVSGGDLAAGRLPTLRETRRRRLSALARVRGGQDYFDNDDGAGWQGDMDFSMPQQTSVQPRRPRRPSPPPAPPGYTTSYSVPPIQEGFDEQFKSASGTPADPAVEMELAIRAFTATLKGKVLLRVGAVLQGMLLGELLRNILGRRTGVGLRMGFALGILLMTFAKGDVGEFARRLGLALAFTAQRFWVTRQQFAVVPQLLALLRLKPRKAFPGEQRGEYNQIQTLLLLVLLGGFIAGKIRIYLCPKWIRSLAGAFAMGLAATGEGPLGDLTRTMGAKTRLLVGTFFAVLMHLGVATLFMRNVTHSAKFVKKVDEQYGIGERVSEAVNKGVSAASQMMQEEAPPRPREDPYAYVEGTRRRMPTPPRRTEPPMTEYREPREPRPFSEQNLFDNQPY